MFYMYVPASINKINILYCKTKILYFKKNIEFETSYSQLYKKDAMTHPTHTYDAMHT